MQTLMSHCCQQVLPVLTLRWRCSLGRVYTTCGPYETSRPASLANCSLPVPQDQHHPYTSD